MGVVTEAEDVAVAREPRPQRGRHAEPEVVCALPQDLEAPEHPRCEHDLLGDDHGGVPALRVAHVDSETVGGRFDPRDLGLDEDLRPLALGYGQVVHVDGRLGRHVAARDARSAVDALVLRVARVGARVAVFEVDRERHRVSRGCGLARRGGDRGDRLPKHGRLHGWRRVRTRLHHRKRPCVVRR